MDNAHEELKFDMSSHENFVTQMKSYINSAITMNNTCGKLPSTRLHSDI